MSDPDPRLDDLLAKLQAVKETHDHFSEQIKFLENEIHEYLQLHSERSKETPIEVQSNEIAITEESTDTLATDIQTMAKENIVETSQAELHSKEPTVSEETKTPEIDVKPIAKADHDAKESPSATQLSMEEMLSSAKASTQQKLGTNKFVRQYQRKPSQDQKPKSKKTRQTHSDETIGIEHLYTMALTFLSKSNPIVIIGMGIFFLGLAFLITYAAQRGVLPIEWRLAGVGLIGVTLIVIGWRTRNATGRYGTILQGGGVATLYLTLYSAAMVYKLFPSKDAFIFMLVVATLGVVLAVLQNAAYLAYLATVGGFLTPILTSDGSGKLVDLLAFYLILDIGVLAVAWFKTWRTLNWLAFVFTFVIGGVAILFSYKKVDYFLVQSLLAIFYGLFLTVSILFSFKQPPNLRGFVDGSLLFGMPLVSFGLQARIIFHIEYGLAYSSFVLMLIYFSIAYFLWKKFKKDVPLLIETFVVLGVGFGTLTIPLAFSHQWTSVSWALEACGLIWIGFRQSRLRSRVTGCILYFAAILYLLKTGWYSIGEVPIISGNFLNFLLLSLSALLIGYLYKRYDTEEKVTLLENIINDFLPASMKNNDYFSVLSYFFFCVGWLWWLFAGLTEINGHLRFLPAFWAVLLFIVGSCALFSYVSPRLKWDALSHVQYWMLPLVIIASITALNLLYLFPSYMVNFPDQKGFHPSLWTNLFAYVTFFALQYYFLYRSKGAQTLLEAYHTLTAWFFFALVFWDVIWQLGHFDIKEETYSLIWFVYLATLVAMLLPFVNLNNWPFKQYRMTYRSVIPLPLTGALIMWFLLSSTVFGNKDFYLTVLINSLDLSMLGALALFYWHKKQNIFTEFFVTNKTWDALFYALSFLWLNVVMLRGIHHYCYIPYHFNSMASDAFVQMAFSILWTTCALTTMFVARKISSRIVWQIGAILMGVVVVKLLIIDLSGRGTIARIVSFMGVGVLMLLIGYFSPIPPKEKDSHKNA